MTLENKCEPLVQTIREIFREGAVLGDEARRFIDSTFCNPSLEELAEALGDEENCEIDSLMDLIFFPDESFQARLEDLLEKDALVKREEAEALRMLRSDPPRTRVRFHDKGAAISLTMPREMVGPFLARLNIRRALDERLLRAIDRRPEENLRRAMKVRLRNSRFDLTEDRVRFLCRFFDRMNPGEEEFLERLDFLLGVMDEAPDAREMYDFLTEKKKSFSRDLRRSTRMKDLLAKSNMETLMVMGVRSPYIYEDDVRNGIRWIDDICLAVFDRMEPINN
ncbi:MAG: hypothetical protein GY859_14640 [Desulfobacterales bacterium]|nr:hypothetical protein [Desulfobacterales bacterium]